MSFTRIAPKWSLAPGAPSLPQSPTGTIFSKTRLSCPWQRPEHYGVRGQAPATPPLLALFDGRASIFQRIVQSKAGASLALAPALHNVGFHRSNMHGLRGTA